MLSGTARCVVSPLVLCAVMAGCSNAYDSALLRLHYDPPSGVKLLDESAGPPGVAHFSGDVEIRVAASALPELDEKKLEELLPQALASAGATLPAGRVTSAKLGTITMGPVARYEFKGPSNRALLYLVPNGARFLVVTLSTPLSTDGKTEAHFEQSLASLRPRD